MYETNDDLHDPRVEYHADLYCIPCRRIFLNNNNLRHHMRSTLHQGRTVDCPMKGCAKSFVSRAALVLHLESGACPSRVTRAMVNRIVAALDEAHAHTRQVLGQARTSPVDVVLYTREEFRTHQGAALARVAAGLYASGAIRINDAAELTPQTKATLVHEYVHAVVDDLVHASGVHATIAGVLLGFAVPVLSRDGQRPGPAERMEHHWRPLSAGVAVPVFALFAAGVSLKGGGLVAALRDPVTFEIVAALVLGKVIGIFGSAFLVTRTTRAQLDEELSGWDLFGVSLLAGIGFTVSLLIGELAFGSGARNEHVKAAVLMASLIAALLASAVLIVRNRTYRRMSEADSTEQEGDRA